MWELVAGVEAGEEEFVVAVLVDDDVVDDVVQGVVEEALGDLCERRLTVWWRGHVGGGERLAGEIGGRSALIWWCVSLK